MVEGSGVGKIQNWGNVSLKEKKLVIINEFFLFPTDVQYLINTEKTTTMRTHSASTLRRSTSPLLVALILLTQISACLRIPGEVRAELKPESAHHDHFDAEPGEQSKTGNEARTTE